MDIKIENLKKTFGQKVAVDIDNYLIKEGTMLGLVGNNGAGKTTLLNLVLDLTRADTGQVTMGDVVTSETEDWKDWTGAFMGDSFLIPYLTPREFLMFAGRISRMTPDEVDKKLQDFTDFAGPEIFHEPKLIRNLSAGTKQKVGIAAALLTTPKVVILDEPFNFLDPSSQVKLKTLLTAYHEATNATIIVSSHNMQHTVDICPRIALIEDGRIIRDLHGTPEENNRELESYFA